MKKNVKLFISHPLISGGFIVFTGTIFANALNFLFNLFMSRNLSVVDYGTLASLISLITLATIPAGAVLPTVVHFAASYFVKNENNKANELFFKIGKISLIAGFLLLFVFVIFSSNLGGFFKVRDNSLIAISGLFVLVSYLSIVNYGLLQAKLAFNFIALSQIIGASLKLLFGAILIFLGFSVRGGMWAYVVAYSITYFISFIPLRSLFHKSKAVSVVPIKELLSYGMPAAVALFSLTSLMTVDVMIVKHFFDPKSAGIYAGISLLGKIVFYFSAPIGTVMFPLITQKFTKKESYRSTLLLSVILVFIPSIFLTAFYFIFPNFVIGVSLKNHEYLGGSSLLGLIGIYMSIFSLIYILTNFCLSIKHTKVYILVFISSILQVGLLWIYHQTFVQVVSVSIVVAALLLASLLLYLISYVRKKN